MRLFETEHANAIISDCFWFIICKVFKTSKKSGTASSGGNLNAGGGFGGLSGHKS
jgi:hypothetical protein